MNWDRNSIDFLKLHYNKDMTIKEIAEHLGATYRAVQLKACRLNLSSSRQKLTLENLNYIRDNYKVISTNQLAKALGVDTHTVRSAMNNMGLENPRSIYSVARKWTKEEENFLINNYKNFSLGVLAEYLNRTPKSIEKKISNLNLGKKGRPKSCESVLEIKVGKYLKEMGFTFERELYIGNHFSVDFYIPRYNLCIEVQGKYWHIDAKNIFLNKTTEKQKKTCLKDLRKKKYILEQGYNLLYLKEDLVNCPNNCKLSILDYLVSAAVKPCELRETSDDI